MITLSIRYPCTVVACLRHCHSFVCGVVARAITLTDPTNAQQPAAGRSSRGARAASPRCRRLSRRKTATRRRTLARRRRTSAPATRAPRGRREKTCRCRRRGKKTAWSRRTYGVFKGYFTVFDLIGFGVRFRAIFCCCLSMDHGVLRSFLLLVRPVTPPQHSILLIPPLYGTCSAHARSQDPCFTKSHPNNQVPGTQGMCIFQIGPTYERGEDRHLQEERRR